MSSTVKAFAFSVLKVDFGMNQPAETVFYSLSTNEIRDGFIFSFSSINGLNHISQRQKEDILPSLGGDENKS